MSQPTPCAPAALSRRHPALFSNNMDADRQNARRILRSGWSCQMNMPHALHMHRHPLVRPAILEFPVIQRKSSPPWPALARHTQRALTPPVGPPATQLRVAGCTCAPLLKMGAGWDTYPAWRRGTHRRDTERTSTRCPSARRSANGLDAAAAAWQRRALTTASRPLCRQQPQARRYSGRHLGAGSQVGCLGEVAVDRSHSARRINSVE